MTTPEKKDDAPAIPVQDSQLAHDDPRTRHPKLRVDKQRQPEPGLDVKTDPVPDIGLDSYRGAGRLTGRKALITGGDSGIGAAVSYTHLTLPTIYSV